MCKLGVSWGILGTRGILAFPVLSLCPPLNLLWLAWGVSPFCGPLRYFAFLKQAIFVNFAHSLLPLVSWFWLVMLSLECDPSAFSCGSFVDLHTNLILFTF